MFEIVKVYHCMYPYVFKSRVQLVLIRKKDSAENAGSMRESLGVEGISLDLLSSRCLGGTQVVMSPSINLHINSEV